LEERERDELVRVARGDIPPQYADPLWIAVSRDGRHAVVVLGINGEPYADVEEVECRKARGRWHMSSSCNGLGYGWTPRHRTRDTVTGLLRLSGEAPAGIDGVVVHWDGDDHEVAVTGGYWFFGAWDVPGNFEDTAGYPRVVAFVSAGRREPAPPDPLHDGRWAFEREHRLRYLAAMRRGPS
jgi:hypothetical protein